jgi:hypothetical protein
MRSSPETLLEDKTLTFILAGGEGERPLSAHDRSTQTTRSGGVPDYRLYGLECTEFGTLDHGNQLVFESLRQGPGKRSLNLRLLSEAIQDPALLVPKLRAKG